MKFTVSKIVSAFAVYLQYTTISLSVRWNLYTLKNCENTGWTELYFVWKSTEIAYESSLYNFINFLQIPNLYFYLEILRNTCNLVIAAILKLV